MGRYCTVCHHPNRETIDVLLVRHTASYRRIAALYGLREASLRRHQDSHLHMSLALSERLQAVLSAANLLERLGELDEATRQMLEEAHHAGDLRTALQAVNESRHNIEAYSRIGTVGELERRLDALEQGKSHGDTD